MNFLLLDLNMFFKNFNWCRRAKPSFHILCVFLLVMLFMIFFTGIFNSISIRFTISYFPKELNKSNSKKCIPRKCTLEQSESQGAVFASFEPVWSGCYGDFYLMAFDNYDTSVYTLIDVGSNKAYAVATWLSFFVPELGINQNSLHLYLISTKKVTYECGSCDDCEDKPLKRNNTQNNVTVHIHAFEPQPDTVVVLKGVQKWMNISERSKSTLDIYGMAVSK